MRDWMVILALGLAACGDKGEEQQAEEDDDGGEDDVPGECPEISLGSDVGEELATGTVGRGEGEWEFCEGAGGSDDDADSGWGRRDWSGKDVTLSWTAPDSGAYTAHTMGSGYDTTLTMLEGGCNGRAVDCDDDGARGLRSAIRFDAVAGTEYVFVLDAYDTSERGGWVFSLVEGHERWGGDSGGWSDWDTGDWGDWDTGGWGDWDNPNVSVSWTSDGLELDIVGGPGDYYFGLAETAEGVTDPWTGEDCYQGYTDDAGDVYVYCHYVGSSGTTLAYGGDAWALGHGTTAFDQSHDGAVTYYLESSTDLGGTGECWVWGGDTSYYAALGCEEL